MPENELGIRPERRRAADRERDHDRRNEIQGELFRRTAERLRLARAQALTGEVVTVATPSQTSTAGYEEPAQIDRRTGCRDRRHPDRRRWWQKGLAFAALCTVLRCWRWVWR